MAAPADLVAAVAGHQARAADETPALRPECEAAWAAFMRVQTQWRMGFAGPVGLDYTACEVKLKALGIRFKSVAMDLEVIELAALAAWAEERDRDD